MFYVEIVGIIINFMGEPQGIVYYVLIYCCSCIVVVECTVRTMDKAKSCVAEPTGKASPRR